MSYRNANLDVTESESFVNSFREILQQFTLSGISDRIGQKVLGNRAVMIQTDTETFYSDFERRVAIRYTWKVSQLTFLIGDAKSLVESFSDFGVVLQPIKTA